MNGFTQSNQGDKYFSKAFDWAVFIVFIFFVFIAIRYEIRIWNYLEWGDESETIVAAKMIISGMKLYSDFFNHHGPLTFLPGIITEFFGGHSIRAHRMTISFLQLITAISLYYSPLITNRLVSKIVLVISAYLALGYYVDIMGQTYMYQVLAGFMLIIIFSSYVLPELMNVRNSKWACYSGIFMLGCLPFLAITYLPITVLTFIACLRKRNFKVLLVLISISILLNVLLLISIGSIKGFYAYHLYMNFEILPQYSFSTISVMMYRIYLTLTADAQSFLFLLIMLFSACKTAKCEKYLPWRTLLIFAGIISLMVRGPGFQALPYYYLIFSLIPVLFIHHTLRHYTCKLAFVIMTFICVLKLGMFYSADKDKIASRSIVSATPFAKLARAITNENDKVIVYSFRPFEYIVSNRLPASGYYFYLPWQEKYNERPVLGVEIDACSDIKNALPKLMYIDKWKVWNRYDWDSYAACVQGVIEQNYTPIHNTPYYISNAFIKSHPDVYLGGAAVLKPSSPLSDNDELDVIPHDSVLPMQLDISSVAIRFATYKKRLTGTIEFEYLFSNGKKTTDSINAIDIQDNEYLWLHIPTGNGSLEKISLKSTQGKLLSVWQSQNELGGYETCSIIKYANGNSHYVKGCPLY